MTRLVTPDRRTTSPFVQQVGAPVLTPIEIPSTVDQTPLPALVCQLIDAATERIRTFQDRWDRPQIEQFVAADYAHVYQALEWTLRTQPTLGRRFLEWGCGFAVVSAMATTLQLDAVGIEAESDLLLQGEQTIRESAAEAQLVHGNFLPAGAERLADDSTLPSLGHPVACGYSQLDLDLDDFAIVYSYPWPGEDDFHCRVFDRYSARGALLLLFCGPNEIRLWRKTG